MAQPSRCARQRSRAGSRANRVPSARCSSPRPGGTSPRLSLSSEGPAGHARPVRRPVDRLGAPRAALAAGDLVVVLACRVHEEVDLVRATHARGRAPSTWLSCTSSTQGRTPSPSWSSPTRPDQGATPAPTSPTQRRCHRHVRQNAPWGSRDQGGLAWARAAAAAAAARAWSSSSTCGAGCSRTTIRSTASLSRSVISRQ